jgi:hypothetical protein
MCLDRPAYSCQAWRQSSSNHWWAPGGADDEGRVPSSGESEERHEFRGRAARVAWLRWGEAYRRCHYQGCHSRKCTLHYNPSAIDLGIYHLIVLLRQDEFMPSTAFCRLTGWEYDQENLMKPTIYHVEDRTNQSFAIQNWSIVSAFNADKNDAAKINQFYFAKQGETLIDLIVIHKVPWSASPWLR